MAGKALPKYKMIERELIRTILAGSMKAGAQFPAEYDLAQKYRVNRLTVRKAEKLLIDKGVLVSVQGRGTFLSEHFERDMLMTDEWNMDENKTIIVLFPEVTSFFYEIIKEIERIAAQNGYTICVMFNNNIERENETVAAILNKQVDGVIASPLRSNNQMSIINYKRLLDARIPLVMVGKTPASVSANCVMCDDISAIYQAVEFLRTKAVDDVIYLYHSSSDYEANMERRLGFELGMRDFFQADHCTMLDVADDSWFSEFQKAAKGKHHVAVFTDIESIVFDVYSYFNQQGKIHGRDFDLMIYNNTNLIKRLNLNVHYIDLPKTEMGKCAFKMLQHMLQTGGPQCEPVTYKVFVPKLVAAQDGDQPR